MRKKVHLAPSTNKDIAKEIGRDVEEKLLISSTLSMGKIEKFGDCAQDSALKMVEYKDEIALSAFCETCRLSSECNSDCELLKKFELLIKGEK
jgi:radical SAM protein with 4Fe4S-binding SPASM domain